MTVTEGGCFRFENQDGTMDWYGLPDWEHDSWKRAIPNLPVREYKSIRLVEWDDSLPGNPIQWISFGGVLFAYAPIFRCDIYKMKQYGLLQE